MSKWKKWDDCKVGAQFGDHGGRQFRSKQHFVCGCDEGKCESHAQNFPLGPVHELGAPRKCKMHKFGEKELLPYIGRSFRLKRAKYRSMIGMVVTITKCEEVPFGRSKRWVLLCNSTSEFSPLMTSPEALGEEVAQ